MATDTQAEWTTLGETFKGGGFTVAMRRYGDRGTARIRVEREKEAGKGVHAFSPEEALVVAKLLEQCAKAHATDASQG